MSVWPHGGVTLGRATADCTLVGVAVLLPLALVVFVVVILAVERAKRTGAESTGLGNVHDSVSWKEEKSKERPTYPLEEYSWFVQSWNP